MVRCSPISPAVAASRAHPPLVSPEAAIKAARQGLSQLHSSDQPGIEASLAAGQAGTPIYVSRCDQAGKGYYLVPWQEPGGISLIVQVDASTGQLASVAVPSIPQPTLVMSAEEARHHVNQKLALRVTAEPVLVWQPCRETASPFLPLYRVETEAGRVFVGMNGAVHQQLHSFMKGGG